MTVCLPARQSAEGPARHGSLYNAACSERYICIVTQSGALCKQKTQEHNTEVLLLKRLSISEWEVLVKPGKKAREGTSLKISDELSLTVKSRTETGERIVEFHYDGVFEDILSRVGSMPLPPYIHEKPKDPNRYQTVYCKTDGSAAAPTAGLHFTKELLETLKSRGVQIAEVLLHVGLGTFRPVKEEDLTEHKMHSEYYMVDEKAAEIVNAAKREGRRVIAVGTTSVRTLETVADENGFLHPCSGNTEIFIYPPYRFKCVDALITNFHLPESTLFQFRRRNAYLITFAMLCPACAKFKGGL